MIIESKVSEVWNSKYRRFELDVARGTGMIIEFKVSEVRA